MKRMLMIFSLFSSVGANLKAEEKLLELPPFQQEVISKTVHFVKINLQKESTGHDYLHAYRVWKNAMQICEKEEADVFVVQLAALLHDISDWKFNGGDLTLGSKVASDFLKQLNVDEDVIEHVSYIIQNVSFKGAKVKNSILSKEGQIVQDADRLDALGAIGIARTFAYGGFKNREIYNPDIPPQIHESFEQYKNSASPAVNHFYEKLLLLKDLMNTVAGKELAEKRHAFMEKFLEEFFKEVK